MKLRDRNPAQIADAIGSQLNEGKRALKEIQKRVSEQEAEVKKLADSIGTKIGKRKLLVGKRWAVGLVEADVKPDLDHKALKAAVGTKLYSTFLKLVPDEELIMQAVKSKKLKLEVLKSCLVKKPKQKRFFMVETAKLNKGLDDE